MIKPISSFLGQVIHGDCIGVEQHWQTAATRLRRFSLMPPQCCRHSPIDMEEAKVQLRITECLTRAVKVYCDEKKPPVVRDVLKSYLFTLCKRRVQFLQAAIANLRATGEEPSESFRVADLIVHPPARWEFEHVDVFGRISDALCCATRYRVCSKFLGVYPLAEDDPFSTLATLSRIPMRHKPTSPWHRAFMRRLEIKHLLGSRGRALVSYARSMTKGEFLEQFAAKPGTEIRMTDKKGRPYTLRRMIPDVPAHALLDRTGYTPEEFWREVKKPNTITPHYPQLELFSITP